MKKVLFAVVLSAVALAFALPTFADPATNQPATKDAAKSMKFTGTIKSMDVAKTMVTLTSKKHPDGKDYTVGAMTKISTIDNPAAKLADLKVGDKVLVTYTEDAAGMITITKIGPTPAEKKAANAANATTK